MATKAQGRVLCWEGASLWLLSAPAGVRYPRTDVHAHHAVQLTLALSGRVDFMAGVRHVRGVAVAVAPDAPHAFQGTGLVAHLFVAPDGKAGRALSRRLFAHEPVASVPTRLLGDLPARLRAAWQNPRHTDDELRALGRALVDELAGGGRDDDAPDARIEALIEWSTARLDQPVRLRDAATTVGLSPGRTRHLFVQHTGLPFRTWVLWRRLVRALEAWAAGDSLTDAAHRAGFADSAHLSRTFRRMFGIAAASLQVSALPKS